MDAFEFVKSIAASLPSGVRSFALDQSHWDPRSQLCPHDSWVQELAIREVPNQPDSPDPISRQDRRLNIELRLWGWSHRNILIYSYEAVTRYSIKMDRLSTGGNRAHGDWLEDSITLSPSGGVIHSIQFHSAAKWTIECADITRSITLFPESGITN